MTDKAMEEAQAIIEKHSSHIYNSLDLKAIIASALASKDAEIERLTKERDANAHDGYQCSQKLADAEARAEKAERALAEGVKVRALKWSDDPRGGKHALAAGLGLYRVLNENWYLNQDYMGKGAKAAAQADYERRILAALEPAAPEGGQAVTATPPAPVVTEAMKA